MKFSDILKAASIASLLSREQILARDRSKKLVKVRAAMAIVAKRNGYGLCAISRGVQRDHSTVVYLQRTYVADPEVMALVMAIESLIERGLPEQPMPKDETPRACIAPFPPGVDVLLKRGFTLVKLRKMHPEWRV